MDRGLSPTLPHVLGHEFAGTVAAVGANLASFHPGNRVVVLFKLGCGHCYQFQTGHENVCENSMVFGFKIDGSYAQYARVPLPDAISYVRRPRLDAAA
jgi:D-arabinose 1-dehydrogenase-like Zn-dependent alcohol dehydrogenase